MHIQMAQILKKKINIINQCCGLFYDFHFLFQHYQKTFFWFWKTNILQYFPHYFQMLLYYTLLRGIRSKRQRNPGESVWTKWIWNDISKKSWKWVMKPLRCRWKLSTTQFIALQAKHMIWMVFLELFLVSYYYIVS